VEAYLVQEWEPSGRRWFVVSRRDVVCRSCTVAVGSASHGAFGSRCTAHSDQTEVHGARWYRLTTVAGGWWWAEAEGEEGEGAAWERRRGKKFGGNWKMKVKWRELLLLYTFIAKAKASFTTHESLVTQHTGSPPCIFLLAFSCLLTLFSSWWLQSWPPNTCDLFNCFLFFYLEEKLKRWWVLTYQLNFNRYVNLLEITLYEMEVISLNLSSSFCVNM
jgi:hypothetical protein